MDPIFSSKNRTIQRFFLTALIGLFLSLAIFDASTFAENYSLESIRKDLSVIDESLFGESSITKKPVRAVLEKSQIRSRDIYRAYLLKAANISDELMRVRRSMKKTEGTLSLQQLGAYSQSLSAENTLFRDRFDHGEEKFLSYRLIQTAVTNLEDALSYWRQADKYRRSRRGSVLARAEDDEVLKIKFQTAQQAIEELSSIIDARDALERDIEFDY